jgi:hypothetical protein
MGGKISIDKHVSNLEEILEMNPKSFSKLKFENKIPDSITQHIKVIPFIFYYKRHCDKKRKTMID